MTSETWVSNIFLQWYRLFTSLLGLFDLNLSPYTALRTLILPPSDLDITFPTPNMISSITSNCFQYLVLECSFDDDGSLTPQSLDDYDWDLIDVAMARFPHPTEVLIYCIRIPLATSKHLLREVLPKCSHRGMIRVFTYDAPIWRELRVTLVSSPVSWWYVVWSYVFYVVLADDLSRCVSVLDDIAIDTLSRANSFSI